MAIEHVIYFTRTVIGLIFEPYKTVRGMSSRQQWTSVFSIFGLSFLYFYLARPSFGTIFTSAGVALFLFVGTVLLFSILPGTDSWSARFVRYNALWPLTYVPTLFWFYGNYFLSVLFPPPRTMSAQGIALSILFLAYSGSLLVWKIILAYLAIRFGSRVHLYRVFYYLCVYLTLSVPLWILLYTLHIFRIPFV